MSIHPAQHPRFAQAMWYAWGQQDAGIGRHVDAPEFALAHATHAVRVDEGQDNWLPSIQDAWKTFIASRQTMSALSEPEIGTIQKRLSSAMNELDACGQGDLANRVHDIFKEVARRTFGEVPA